MADLAELAIRVASQNVKQAQTDLDALTRAAGRSETEVKQFGNTSDRANRQAKQLSDVTSQLTRVFSVLAGSLVVRQIIDYADSWSQVQGRLSLVTDSSAELATATSRLFDIAQSTRVEFEATANLYQRLALSTRDLNLSQEELFQLTDTVNKALIVSGATSQQASNALLQLGQAIAGGTVRAEEFNSIIENTPRLAQAIADGLDEAGGSMGRLRQIVIDGGLSSEAALRAVQSQAETLAAEFEKMPKTVSQAFTVMVDSVGRLIGEVNQATGATSALAEEILRLSRNVNALVDIIRGVEVDETTRSITILEGALSRLREQLNLLENQQAQGFFESLLNFDPGRAINNLLAGLAQFVFPDLQIKPETQAIIERLSEALVKYQIALEEARAKQEETASSAERLGRVFNPLRDTLFDISSFLPDTTGLFKALADAEEEAAKQAEQAADAFQKQREAIAQDIELLETELEAVRLLNEGLISEAEAIDMVNRKRLEHQDVLPDEINAISALNIALATEEERQKAVNAAKEDAIALRQSAVDAAIAETQATVEFIDNLSEQNAMLALENDLLQQVSEGTLTAAEAQRKLAEATLDASAAGRNLSEVDKQVIADHKELSAENERLKSSLNSVGGAAIDLVDIFDQAFEGIILGTRDLGSIFESFGLALAKDFGKSFLFGKNQSFDIPFIGNLTGLVGPNGIVGDLFGVGGGIAANAFGGSLISAASDFFLTNPILEAVGFSTLSASFRTLGVNAGAAFGPGFASSLGTSLSVLGPAAVVAGLAIGIPSIIGLFNQPGRIQREKESAERFFQSVFEGVDFKIFDEGGVASALFDAEEFRDAGFALGLVFAEGVNRSTQGTSIRFGGQFLANLERFGTTAEEATVSMLQLAEGLGFNLAGAIQEANRQLIGGNLQMSVFREEMREARDNLSDFADTSNLTRQELEDLALANGNTGSVVLDYASVLAGALDVQLGFNAAVDSAAIINGLLADKLLEVAADAGIADEAVGSLAEQLRSGALSLEEVANQLDGINLTDLSLEPEEIIREVTLIEAALETLGGVAQSVGALLTGAFDPDFGGFAAGLDTLFDTIFRDSIISAFQASITAALDIAVLQPLLTDFGRALSDLIAGNITADEFSQMAADIRSDMQPAIDALAVALGVASDELESILQSLGLLPETAQQAADDLRIDRSRITPGIPSDLQGRIDSFVGDPFLGLDEEIFAIRQEARQLGDELIRSGISAREYAENLEDIRAATDRRIDQLFEEAFAPSQAIIDDVFGPASGLQGFLDNVADERANLEALATSARAGSEELSRVNDQLDRLAEAEAAGIRQFADEALEGSQGFIDQFLPPGLDEALARHEEAAQAWRDDLLDAREALIATGQSTEDVDRQLRQLDFAEAIGVDQIIESLSPISGFFETLRSLPETIGRELTTRILEAIEPGQLDFSSLDVGQLEAALNDIVARTIFNATVQAIVDAFVVAPIQSILDASLAGVAGSIVTSAATGGATLAASGAVAGSALQEGGVNAAALILAATDALNAVADNIGPILDATLRIFTSEEFASFQETIGQFLQTPSAGGGGGRGGGGGGGGGGAGIQTDVDALDDALQAIIDFARDVQRTDLKTTLADIAAEVEDLGNAFINASLEENLRALFRSPFFDQFESVSGVFADILDGLTTLAEGAARRIEEAIVNQIQPALDFLDSGTGGQGGVAGIIREFTAASEAIAEAEDILSEYVDTTQLQADLLEVLNERLTEFIADTLEPFAQAIADIGQVDPRPIADILADIGSAETIGQVADLQDELIAAVEANFEAQQTALEQATEENIAAIEARRDKELEALEEAQDKRRDALQAEIDLVEQQIQAIEDAQESLTEFIQSIPETFQAVRDDILDIFTPLSEVLAQIGQAGTLEDLEALQDLGIAAIVEDLRRAREELEGLVQEEIDGLIAERRANEEQIRERISNIDRLIQLRRQLQQQELADLETRESNLQRLIRLRQEEETGIEITQQAVDRLRDAAQRLRDEVSGSRFGPASLLSPDRQLALGLSELTDLQRQIAEDPTNQETIQSFTDLIARVRDLNRSVNVSSQEAVDVNERINEQAEFVASLLEGQATDIERQIAELEQQNATLSEIEQLVQNLGLTGDETIDELKSLLSETTNQIAAIDIGNGLLEEIKELEEALDLKAETTISELENMRDLEQEALIELQRITDERIQELQQELSQELAELNNQSLDNVDQLEAAIQDQSEALLSGLNTDDLENQLADLNNQMISLENTFQDEQQAVRDKFEEQIQLEKDALEDAISALQVETVDELQQLQSTVRDRLQELVDAIVADPTDVLPSQAVVDAIRVEVAPILQGLLDSVIEIVQSGVIANFPPNVLEIFQQQIDATVNGFSGLSGTGAGSLAAQTASVTQQALAGSFQGLAGNLAQIASALDVTLSQGSLNSIQSARTFAARPQAAPEPISITVPVQIGDQPLQQMIVNGVLQMRNGKRVFVSIDNIDEQSVDQISQRTRR